MVVKKSNLEELIESISLHEDKAVARKKGKKSRDIYDYGTNNEKTTHENLELLFRSAIYPLIKKEMTSYVGEVIEEEIYGEKELYRSFRSFKQQKIPDFFVNVKTANKKIFYHVEIKTTGGLENKKRALNQCKSGIKNVHEKRDSDYAILIYTDSKENIVFRKVLFDVYRFNNLIEDFDEIKSRIPLIKLIGSVKKQQIEYIREIKKHTQKNYELLMRN